MDARKQKQIKQVVNAEYRVWIQNLPKFSTAAKIYDDVNTICQSICKGVIITTSRHGRSAYLGSYTQCLTLKKSFKGQVGAINNLWYWIGYASADDIRKLVKNTQRNVVISVPEIYLTEAVLLAGDTASVDIKYGSRQQGCAAYVGCYKVCLNLKRLYKGKIGKSGNHWYWIGKTGFEQIDNVFKANQQKSKRYRRRYIVLTD